MYLIQKKIGKYKYWYLEETERTEKGPKKAFSIYLGKPDRIFELVREPLKRLLLSSHTFGTTAALLHVVEELGLDEILEDGVPLDERVDMTPTQRLLMIMGARYERPASKLRTAAKWYKKSVLPLLWRCNPVHVNTLYDIMDRLTLEVRQRVKDRLRARLLDMDIEPRRLVWDTTNFYTYGEVDELRRRGRSKDGKHQCPLVGMGVLTSERNIPLAQVVFPGNRHDKVVFERALPSLLSLVEEVTDDPKKITFIFDTGCNDEDLIKTIERTSHCVGKLKRNQDPADLLRIPVEDLDLLYRTERDHEVRGLKTMGEVFGEDRTLVVRWHEGTAEGKGKSLKYYRERAFEQCRDLEKRVEERTRGRKFTSKGIRDCMESLGEVEQAIDWSFDEEERAFSWKFIENEWERLLDEAGKSLLFSTHEDWSAEQIVRTYDGKWRIEHSFRLLKGPIPVRPIYHGRGDRIRTHYFLMFLLLVSHRYLMEQIREPVLDEFGVGENTVHYSLQNLHLITGKLPDSNKPEFKLEEMDELQEAIVANLGLERFVPATK